MNASPGLLRKSVARPFWGGASESAASPLQLQFGSSLEELSITLTHGDHAPGDTSALLQLRLRNLDLLYLRRADSYLKLRLSGSTLDCYDLRDTSRYYHVVGAAGNRTHTRSHDRAQQRESDKSKRYFLLVLAPHRHPAK